jgi:hypothetical protein
MQPILGPGGIEYLEPTGGFNLVFTAKDRIRWAHLVQHMRQKGVSLEMAERRALQQIYQIKHPKLTYS